MTSVLDELKKRDLLKDVTNLDKFEQAVAQKKAIYIGFDPTAISLHLGNYVQLNILKIFKKHHIKIVPVLGGATGMIGDPSGKSAERTIQDEKTLQKNSNAIKKQLETILQSNVVDNYAFYKDLNVLDFLRNVGKNINVNYMLEKEQISSRLENGISYTEFSYMLLQAYDFYMLYTKHDVAMQAGGSDQWGNITTGVDFIRKMVGEQNVASGLTFNLLTKSDGKKFGKSEQGAIFLDSNLTSPYEMYQFLINQPDEEVIKLLKALTQIETSEINTISTEHAKSPHLRHAQKILAETIVQDIHGKNELEEVKKITNLLFSGKILDIEPEILKNILAKLNNFVMSQREDSIVNVLVNAKICSSKREANDLLKSNGISINGEIANTETIVSIDSAIKRDFSVIRKGKKAYFLITWNNI